jgi:hypothetical protein
LPSGTSWFVVVTQVNEAMRFRQFIAAAPNLENDNLTDAQIEALVAFMPRSLPK